MTLPCRDPRPVLGLVQVRRELHDERTNCENLRIEANKLYTTYKQKKKQIQEQCSQINKLNTVINMTEDEMLHLKKKYEIAVEDRNFTGLAAPYMAPSRGCRNEARYWGLQNASWLCWAAAAGGGGVGTRPRYLIVCLWRRLLASRHCSF